MRSPKLPPAIPVANAPTQASYLSRGTTGSGPKFNFNPSPITPVTGVSTLARTGRPSLLGKTV